MAQWSHLLTDTVTYALRTGVDGYGQPESGPPQEARARVEWRSTLVRDVEGNEVQSEGVVVSEVEIPRDAKLWLEGDTSPRRIITTAKAAIPGGPTLYEVYL